jgi:hypothetical protein
METDDLQKVKSDMGQVISMIHQIADAVTVLTSRVESIEHQAIIRGFGSTADAADKRVCRGMTVL